MIESLIRAAGALAAAAEASTAAATSPPWGLGMDKVWTIWKSRGFGMDKKQILDISAKAHEMFFFIMSTNPMAILGNMGKFLDSGASNEDPGDQWYG